MGRRSKVSPTYALHPSTFPSLIGSLRRFFASRGIEAYLVGGVVRDALLKRDTGDIDVAVAADVDEVGRELASFLGGRLVALDAAGQVTRVVVPGSGGASVVDLSRMPDGIEADLGRRDFTVDAMALPLAQETSETLPAGVVDPHGGLVDLRDGVIRAVAPSVFEEDPARLLRGPRLSVQLRFQLATDTARQIRRRAHLVKRVAPERVRDELLKLLAEPGASATLRLLDELGLLCEILPELASAKGVTQPKEHHWDVFEHLLETAGEVERAISRRAEGGGFVEEQVPRFEGMDDHFGEEVSDGHTRLTLVKLTGLLHDIAKPATRTVDESGRIRFLGHHQEGTEVAEGVLRRLRFSGRGVALVRLMVYHHLRPSQMAQKGQLPTGRAVFRYFRDVGEAAIDTLYLNMADYLAARGPSLRRDEWSDHCRLMGHIIDEGLGQKAPEKLRKLIDGHDIMREFSLGPGPQVGFLRDLVQEAQASGEIRTREEALQLVRDNLRRGDDRA